ncbi:MAG: NADH-quinone oxidoreductase subunit I [Planctomycetota bacterium]|nr:NADH-quinone oxidoreductase subunit I [Planctomycetota bacterium]
MASSHETPKKPDERPGKSLLDRSYLVEIGKGLANTFMHMIGGSQTVQYPERTIYDYSERERAIGHENPRSRGEHILVEDELGREKCVACLLCMAACPAVCIFIEPEAAPEDWKDRDRRPKTFEIDMLRCIYCGYCEEACPCDAIRLTPKPYTVTTSREERIYDKERLLKNNPGYQTPQRPKK